MPAAGRACPRLMSLVSRTDAAYSPAQIAAQGGKGFGTVSGLPTGQRRAKPEMRVPEVRVPEVHSPPERLPRQEGTRTRARETARENAGHAKDPSETGKGSYSWKAGRLP